MALLILHLASIHSVPLFVEDSGRLQNIHDEIDLAPEGVDGVERIDVVCWFVAEAILFTMQAMDSKLNCSSLMSVMTLAALSASKAVSDSVTD